MAIHEHTPPCPPRGVELSLQEIQTANLRTWTGMLEAIKDQAERAASFGGSAAERVGYAARREGAA